MANSNLEAYLSSLIGEAEEVLPEPTSRVDYYLHYLIKGGNLEDLPTPISRMDFYLEELCKKGNSGNEGTGNNHGALDAVAISNYEWLFIRRPAITNELSLVQMCSLEPLQQITVSEVINIAI